MLGALPASAWASPNISVAVYGPQGNAGWYIGNVVVNWSVTDTGPFTTVGCAPSTTYSSDTTGTVSKCEATSQDMSTTSKSVVIHLDKTPPSVVANADRSADAGGFYNHPLTATWTGSDPTSGIAACTSTPYAGPDGSGIALSGSCTDKAGNTSASVPFVFNYDATAPTLGDVSARPGDGGARIAWEASGASQIVVTRSSGSARAAQSAVVYDGSGAGFSDGGLTNGTRYTYAVQAFDLAGNVATANVSVTPSSLASTKHLLSPGHESRVRKAPMLRWREIRKASYYNIQLFRKGKKILSAWPRKPHYQLHNVWRYGGKRHRMVKGTYWWYIWAGYGHRSQHRYGKLLGRRSFIVS
jgi:hypothetical protein